MFLQNHGGVYRSDDHGGSWESIAAGLPVDFGFPVVVHPHEPDTVYVFPLNGGDRRYPPNARGPGLARHRTPGSPGRRWARDCPTSSTSAVMRDAMCADAHDSAGIYFGGRNGTVWGSSDSGDSWRQVVANLPDVMCVRAAAI